MCFCLLDPLLDGWCHPKKCVFLQKNTRITIKKNVNVLFKKSFISSGVGYSFINQMFKNNNNSL